jgi:hypothetical protein
VLAQFKSVDTFSHLLKLVVSFRPPRTSFKRLEGSDRDAISLCRQITPIPASFACRVWHAMMNGSTKFGLRTRSNDDLAVGD